VSLGKCDSCPAQSQQTPISRLALNRGSFGVERNQTSMTSSVERRDIQKSLLIPQCQCTTGRETLSAFETCNKTYLPVKFSISVGLSSVFEPCNITMKNILFSFATLLVVFFADAYQRRRSLPYATNTPRVRPDSPCSFLLIDVSCIPYINATKRQRVAFSRL